MTTVGVDLGKTSCRAQLLDGPEARGPGAPGLAEPGGVDEAVAAVRRVVDEVTSGQVPGSLGVGAAGAEAAPDATSELATRLAETYHTCAVAVTSDSVAGHAGALAGGAGAVLSVGTGAVAVGLDSSGRRTTVDGWGPWLGDLGGGAWIGREALRAVLRAREGRGVETSLSARASARYGDLDRLPRTLNEGPAARITAAFVPDVVASALADDEVALDILAGAADAWCDLAVAAVRASGGIESLSVVGGLWEVPILADLFRDRLPGAIALLRPAGDATDGALLLAARTDLPHESSVTRVTAPSRPVPDAAVDVDRLATEQVRPDLADLDTRTPTGLVTALLEAEATVPGALSAARPALAAAVTLAAAAISDGGRLVYVGAGTPGRLAALDAAECPPTYGVPPDVVVAVVAGGDTAAVKAVEGAEDDAEAGWADLGALEVGPEDVVVGITSSGRTPYVLAALEAARRAGSATVAVVNNSHSPAAALADVAVEALTGAEVLAGSTRLKAGTAQKIVLNVISTGAMIRAGHTYGAWMVDIMASNEKLRLRARRILREAAGVDDDAALAALEDAGWETKTALVALLAGVPTAAARDLLDRSDGYVRRALEAAR